MATWILIFLIFCGEKSASLFVENSTSSIVHYLQKFGYLSNYNNQHSSNDANFLHKAISNYQASSGLQVTGIADFETLKLMNLPRCSVANVPIYKIKKKRKRIERQAEDYDDEFDDIEVWNKMDLTYRMYQYSEDLTIEEIDEMVDRAFQWWSENTNFTFDRREEAPVDIEIGFVDVDHGDDYPFPIPEQSLAHAFPPLRGDIHLNEFINWTIGPREEMWIGVDVYQVLVHEIGHALGLTHSDNPEAIMYPMYKAVDDPLYFQKEDLHNYRQLYEIKRVPNKQKNKCPRIQICEVYSYDAVVTDADGFTYVFKDDYYWKLGNGTDLVMKGYPHYIKDDWANITSVDAAVLFKRKYLILFQGKNFWIFENGKLSSGFPKLIEKALFGLPNSLETAFKWVRDNRTYFFKDNHAWKLFFGKLRKVNRSMWKGLPKKIDTAFVWFDNRTYFFVGSEYYRFDEYRFKLEPGYPRSIILDWFGCYRERPIAKMLRT